MFEQAGSSIDSEIILKSVAEQVQREQDELVYMIKKADSSNETPLRPVLHWAQSVDQVHLMIRLHPGTAPANLDE